MVETVNDDIYARLLDATFDVELDRQGTKMHLKCRDIPFSTLMSIVGQVATSAREELVRARRIIIDDVVAMGAVDINPNQLVDVLAPVIQAAILEVPSITTRFLQDVVVGMTTDKVNLFTVEDIASILDATLARMDIAKISKKVSSVFSHATKISELIVQTQATAAKKKFIEEKKKTQKSSSQKESPAS